MTRQLPGRSVGPGLGWRIPLVFGLFLALYFVWAGWCGVLTDAGTNVSGAVVGADGAPLDGVRVSLLAPKGRFSGRRAELASTITDSQGCFHLFSLHSPGEPRLTVESSSHEPFAIDIRSGWVNGQAVLETVGSGEQSRGEFWIQGEREGGHPDCLGTTSRLRHTGGLVDVHVLTIGPTHFNPVEDPPWLGRLPMEADFLPQGQPVAVLNYSLWQAMGGEPDVLGVEIQLDAVQLVVIGVMPPEFRSISGLLAWVPRQE